MYKFADLAIARSKRSEKSLTIAYVHGHLCMLFFDIRDFSSLSMSIDLLDGLLRDHPIPNWVPILDYVKAV